MRATIFDLTIRSDGSAYSLHAAAPDSIGDLAAQPFALPFRLAELPQQRKNAADWVKQARVALRRGSDEQRQAREFGTALFVRLFVGETLAGYRAARARLGPDERLLLRLRLPPELTPLPWELVYDPQEELFLALDPRVTLVRHPELARPLAPLRVNGPLEVVVVLASPQSKIYAPLNLTRELARIQSALRDLERDGRLRLTTISGPGTLRQLRARLRQPVHVLHVISHGDLDQTIGEGILIFEDADGFEELVNAELLRQYIQLQRGQTRLVLLNACLGALPPDDDPFGSMGAALLRADVPAVIAMQFELPDSAAADLSEVFYDEIAAGQPVDLALSRARLHLYGKFQQSLDWAIPVLYLRAADGLLFGPPLVEQQPKPGVTPATLTPQAYPPAQHPTSPPPKSDPTTFKTPARILFGPAAIVLAALLIVAVVGLWQRAARTGSPAPTAEPTAPVAATTTPEVHATQRASSAPTDESTAMVAAAATPLPAWIPEMIEVPAGPFLMGSSNTDSNAGKDEKPQRELTLPTYWIGKTEVTNAQFRPFVEGNGYTNKAYWSEAGWQWREKNKWSQPGLWDDPKWNGDQQPVVGVSWYEASAYCRWLSAQTGQDYLLPSEAEWEKAARGRDGRIYPWGDEWQSAQTNSSEADIGATTPVGQYPNGASPYGVLDMVGNVWEWTRSEYKDYPYNPDDGREDGSKPAQKRFTFRGGSWRERSIDLRAAYRKTLSPDYFVLGDVGFRLARHPS